MTLRSLLLSSDEKTVRVLRRVLSDLEIGVEVCHSFDAAIRKLTRQRFEAIVLDCSNLDEARKVLKAAGASPANNRAVAILLVDAAVGLRGGFDLGGHFVLHKPLSAERARSSFRAVRALMKRERRRQGRVAVQVPVQCRGTRSSKSFYAHTLDLCEGGMAIQFEEQFSKENSLTFWLELPGLHTKLECEGELAWEGRPGQAGVRFTTIAGEHAFLLRNWLSSQLPEPEQDDPPLTCRLSDLTLGGCYLETTSPFCVGTRVTLSLQTGKVKARASGLVRVMHPEFGMGVEFSQDSTTQQEQVHRTIEALRTSGLTAPELQVDPDGLEDIPDIPATPAAEDSLVRLFRQKAHAPVQAFLQEMRQQRVSDSR